MLKHHLDRASGVLTLAPDGPLGADDFVALAREVDPFIAERGLLTGLLIQARAFPGWEDFPAFLGHLGFVRDHVARVRRVAVATDSSLLALVPQVAGFFVHAEVRHFAWADCDAAIAWLARP